jgi:hypothetical protein
LRVQGAVPGTAPSTRQALTAKQSSALEASPAASARAVPGRIREPATREASLRRNPQIGGNFRAVAARHHASGPLRSTVDEGTIVASVMTEWRGDAAPLTFRRIARPVDARAGDDARVRRRRCPGEEAAMTATTLIAVAAAAALLGLPARAAGQAPCCDEPGKPCRATHVQPCCAHRHDAVAEPIDQPDVERRPGIERMMVRFANPVLVGDRILMGTHVIEHDTNRMARGQPCTFIYAYNDRRLPVVAFHCTHLKRAARAQPSVTLVSEHAAGLKRLTEFQFGGETAGHGVAVVR